MTLSTILDGHSDLVTVCLVLLLIVVAIIIGRIIITILSRV